MSADRENITPFATAYVRADHLASDEEDRFTKTPISHSSSLRRRLCLICCGSCTAIVVVIAIVLVIITFTVYKVKEPVMTMNSVSFKNLNISTSPLSINISVVADLSVNNPNAVSFRFGESTTTLYYREREIGVAYGPPGTAGARKTFRLNVTGDVMADRLLTDPNLIRDLESGKLDMTTSTKVGGKAKVFLIIEHHVDVMMICSMTLAVSNQSILAQSCDQSVWL